MSETSKKNIQTPLDDVMIAMDVVDTLRHDRKLVDRELDTEARREDLIDRLREIYRSQGIEVPDHILEEGVQALEEDRFKYDAPDGDDWSTKLARVYVSRWQWGRYVIAIVGAILAYFIINFFFFERPAQQRLEAERVELETRLPTSLKKLAGDIQSEATDERVGEKAAALLKTGLNAAGSEDLKTARQTEKNLQEMLTSLREEYDIRIVNRRGVVSGLWRIPKVNQERQNYYLVVEAISAEGKTLAQWITNEETGKREKVRLWAIRVAKSVLDKVRADKEDDGIIQNSVVGRKVRGSSEIEWLIPVSGGAITKWN